MQLAISFLFLIMCSFINAQDTLQYKNYIDYERNDHIARVKSTVLTKTGDFLPDGVYCFEGNAEDFDLLLKTSRPTMRKKFNINDNDILYLTGRIKDSIKTGDWYIKNSNKPIISTLNHTIDSIKIESYNYDLHKFSSPKYFFYENTICNTQEITNRLICTNSLGQSFNYGQGSNHSYRKNFCNEYKYEVYTYNRNDTIITNFEIEMEEYIPSKYTGGNGTLIKDNIHILIIEIVKNHKLVKFQIKREDNINADKYQKMKEYDFYPEFRYNFSKCWKLE